MAKPNQIELRTGEKIPILYEDRSVLAIDKPAGWMLIPYSWQKTNRNLQAALTSSIAAGDFWARSRNLKFLRNVHRLDGETSGILLFAKSQGALETFSDMFESRQMEKRYLAVVEGAPDKEEWTARHKLGPDPNQIGRIIVDVRNGKDAETSFRVLARKENLALIEACPVTGRTHQIRVHLQQGGLPIAGDPLYGAGEKRRSSLGLRAIALAYLNPFERRRVSIEAPADRFLAEYGFTKEALNQPASPKPSS